MNKKFVKSYKLPIQYRLRRHTNSWFIVNRSQTKFENDHKHYHLYGHYKELGFTIYFNCTPRFKLSASIINKAGQLEEFVKWV